MTRTNREFIKDSINYYESSSQDNIRSARLSSVISIGMGMLSGCGVMLIIEGKPFVGTIAAVSSGYTAWKMAEISKEELMMAKEDTETCGSYLRQLAELEITEDLE